MEKWHTMTAGEVEKTLAARTSGEKKTNDVFLSDAITFSDLLAAAFGDPVLPFYGVCAVLVSLFSQSAASAVLLLLVTFSLFCASLIRLRAQKTLRSTADFLIPHARRSAGGTFSRVSARQLVPGDRIRLREGDVVPADARLIRSELLTVREMISNPTEGAAGNRRIVKDAKKIYAPTDEEDTFLNMVYAGSVVLSGSADAIVTDVGDDTKAGILYSGCRLPETHRLPAALTGLCRSSHALSTAFLIAVIPLTLLILLSGKSSLPLYEIFFILLTAAVSAVPGGIVSAAEVLLANWVRSVGTVSRSLLLKPERLPDLVASDTLIVLDRSVLYPRNISVVSAFSCGSEFADCALTDPALDRSAALIGLLGAAASENDFSDAIASALPHLLTFSGLHSGEPMFRFLGFSTDENDKEQTVRFRAARQEDPPEKALHLRLTTEFDSSGKWFFRAPDGTAAEADEGTADRFRSFLREAGSENTVCVFLVSEEDGSAILEAAFSIGCRCPFLTRETIRKLSRYGIETVIPVPGDTSPAEERLIADAVGPDAGTADLRELRLGSADGLSETLSYAVSDNHVFLGCTDSDPALITSALISSGRKPLPLVRTIAGQRSVSEAGILGVSAGSHEMLGEAAVFSLPRTSVTDKVPGILRLYDILREAGSAALRLAFLRGYLFFGAFYRIVSAVTALLLIPDLSLSIGIGIIAGGFLMDLLILCGIASGSAVPAQRTTAAAAWTAMRGFGVSSVICGALCGMLVPFFCGFRGEDFPSGLSLWALLISFAAVPAGVHAAGLVLRKILGCTGKISVCSVAVFAVTVLSVALCGILTKNVFLICAVLIASVCAFALTIGVGWIAWRAARRREEESR